MVGSCDRGMLRKISPGESVYGRFQHQSGGVKADIKVVRNFPQV